MVVRAQITFRNPSKLLPIKKCFYAWDWLREWESEEWEWEGTEGGNGEKKLFRNFPLLNRDWYQLYSISIILTNYNTYVILNEWVSKQENLPRFYIIYIEIKWKRNYTL